MISDRTYHQLINTCDFSRQKESDECETLYSYAMEQEFGNIDQYNIYAPPCNKSSDGGGGYTGSSGRRSMRLPHLPHSVRIYLLCFFFNLVDPVMLFQCDKVFLVIYGLILNNFHLPVIGSRY